MLQGYVGVLLEFPPKCHTLGCPPSQVASDHQDYYIFRIGNPELNLHFHYYWEGGQPKSYTRFGCYHMSKHRPFKGFKKKTGVNTCH